MKIVILSAFLFFSCFSISFSQQVINIDSLYKKADYASKHQDFNFAIKLCDSIIAINNNHYDAHLLRARVYAWKREWQKAELDLVFILATKSEYIDAWTVYANVELWSGNYKKLIDVASKALEKYPKNEFFLFKMAQAYYGLQIYEDAKKYIDQLLAVHDQHPEALVLQKKIKEEGAKNKITLFTEHSFFNKVYTPSHLYSLEYSRRIKKTIVTPRINYYQRFGLNDWQFETDAYPRFGKTFYGYINAGISGNVLFPKYRAGLELYARLPFAMEASIGYRDLVFISQNVSIITGYVGKYWKNYWFAYRPFITPKNNGVSLSNTIIARRYFASAQEYISLSFSNGFSPDDAQKQFYFSYANYLDSYRAGIMLQKKIINELYFKTEYSFEYFEGSTSTFYNKHTLNAGLFLLF